jgi:hypothetical protein
VAVVQYTFTHKQYIERYKTNNTYNTTILEECGPCPVLASYTLAFALQPRKKHLNSIHVHRYIYIYIYIYMYVCMYIMYVRMHMYVYVRTYVCMYVKSTYIYIYMCVCVCVCVYIYIYIVLCVYVLYKYGCVCVYIYVQGEYVCSTFQTIKLDKVRKIGVTDGLLLCLSTQLNGISHPNEFL